jgi:DNA-3-methyladenine glycosylase I
MPKTSSTNETKEIVRCPWAGNDPLMQAYHDEEWGRPERDSRVLWESLMLDGFQAGLSWITILRKREAFRKAFHNFDPHKVARYTEKDILRLLDNTAIIRSRAKIEATIKGAQIFVEMEKAGEDFATYIWSLAGGKPIHNHCRTMADIPAKTPLSEEISATLKKRGFKFVGPVIVYAWLQATGIVNDHLSTCFCYKSAS